MSSFFRKFIPYYLPALLWMVLIFFLSSFHDLKTGASLVFWEIILRKLAHAGEFSVLAFLFFRIFHRAHRAPASRAFWLSIVGIVFYGASDEIHQMFVSGREAKIFDVGVDVLGAYLGLYLLVGFRHKINKAYLFFLAVIIFGGLLIYKAEDSVRTYGTYVQKVENGKELPDTQGIKNDKLAEDIPSDEEAEEAGIAQDVQKLEKAKEIPEKFVIPDVPFTSQAPFAKWDEYHEEACEEASVLMVKYYLDKKPLSKETAEKEIQAMISFEIKKYGDYRDSDASQIVDLGKNFYGLEGLRAVYDFQKNDIKEYLAKGNPIIVPAAGRLLGNPNFTPPGPLYHNLVLIGYDGNMIITNDPGTRKGAGYRYDLDTLYQAIHDFPGKKADIEKGRKAMIVLE